MARFLELEGRWEMMAVHSFSEGRKEELTEVRVPREQVAKPETEPDFRGSRAFCAFRSYHLA